MERERIADMILNGELIINNNGLVTLSEEDAYLSDSGQVCVVKYNNSISIYFYEYRGLLGDSRGYLFVFPNNEANEKIVTYSDRYNFTNLKNVPENWYSCTTSDD